MAELYRQLTGFPNLYSAFKKAFKRNKNNPGAADFFLNLEKNLFTLKDELLTRKYKPGKYHYFKIKDPKERIISDAPFRDKVVHHALVDIIEPRFEPVFIDNSFACRKGKGTHKAVLLAQYYMRFNRFYLKMDIEKYFETIDHLKLVDIFLGTVQDEDVLWLLRTILATSEQSSGVKDKSIPIGNLTSQFLANVYLNKLDHFAIKNLSIQCYIRYMDDIVIFHPDKERLKTVRDRLTQFVGKELLLKVKERATVIQRRENGLGFLGYRVFPGLTRVKNKNIKKLKRKVSIREKQYRDGIIGLEQLVASVQSILGYFNFADAGHLKRHIFAGE
jgi:RNA-directed DNA polymerase